MQKCRYHPLSFQPQGTVCLIPSSPFPLTSCSNIGKTDPNPPLVVSQSRQRAQGIPQQGKKGSDMPGSILNSVGSCWPLRMTLLWPQLESTTISHCLAFFSRCLNVALEPFHLSIIRFFYFSPHQNSLLFPPFLQILSFVTFFTFLGCRLTFPLSLPPSSPTVSHPPFALTPTGSQGASRLPPSDRLCRHHGPSILQKRRLGPCESFTFILFCFCLSLLLFSGFLIHRLHHDFHQNLK